MLWGRTRLLPVRGSSVPGQTSAPVCFGPAGVATAGRLGGHLTVLSLLAFTVRLVHFFFVVVVVFAVTLSD